jgi:hypothetical protein
MQPQGAHETLYDGQFFDLQYGGIFLYFYELLRTQATGRTGV